VERRKILDASCKPLLVYIGHLPGKGWCLQKLHPHLRIQATYGECSLTKFNRNYPYSDTNTYTPVGVRIS
jgi:hypothetical protein